MFQEVLLGKVVADFTYESTVQDKFRSCALLLKPAKTKKAESK
jgi:hypothetical protein